MLPSAEVQRDLPPAADRYDAAGEGSRASVVPAARHLKYPHAGVVVMHHTALRRLPDELVQHGFEPLRGCLHQLPLRGRRQGNPQLPLQPPHAVKWHSRAIFQKRDHNHGSGIELFRTRRLRLAGGEHLPAGIAAQPFHLEHSRLQRRLPGNADQCRRFLLTVHSSFPASRAGVAGLERGMRDGYSVRSRKRIRAVAPVSRRRLFLRFRRIDCSGWRFRFQHGAGLLRVPPPH